MHCHQARERLTALRGQVPEGAGDRDLREHLRACDACRAFAEAERLLESDLVAEREHARVAPDDLPLAVVRARVEHAGRAPARQTARISKGTLLMNKIQHSLSRRPSLSISVAAVAILLIVLTVIPFSVDETVGYQVALAGVNPDLALDGDRVQELLDALDADNARFDVGDCDKTCKVYISDLKDTNQVRLVIEAFNEMGEAVVEDISSIIGGKHKKLVELIHSGAVKVFTSDMSEEDIHAIVLERLDSLHGAHQKEFNVWVTRDDIGSGDTTITMTFGDSIHFVHQGAWNPAEDLLGVGDTTAQYHVTVEHKEDGTTELMLTNADGSVETYDLTDQADIERLRERGFDIQQSGDGHDIFTYSVTVNNEDEVTEDETVIELQGADDTANKDGLVPEGFALGQNYPNPFNPTTEIAFTLPQAEQVTLDVYNINGQRVRRLVDEVRSAGEHVVTWDGTNDGGTEVASGVYLYRISAGDFSASKKMNLVK